MACSKISFPFSKVLVGASAWCVLTLLGVLGIQQWEIYRDATDQQNVERLTRMVDQYRIRTGRKPDLNMIELFRAGISRQRLHRTPYGGTYQIDPARMVVYNPHRCER
jgi:hypothetical protein